MILDTFLSSHPRTIQYDPQRVIAFDLHESIIESDYFSFSNLARSRRQADTRVTPGLRRERGENETRKTILQAYP